jgi:hypothetical protein
MNSERPCVCTCRPDCPCQFCTRVRAQLVGKVSRMSQRDDIARQFIEEWFDRAEDERVFGTPQRKPN